MCTISACVRTGPPRVVDVLPQARARGCAATGVQRSVGRSGRFRLLLSVIPAASTSSPPRWSASLGWPVARVLRVRSGEMVGQGSIGAASADCLVEASAAEELSMVPLHGQILDSFGQHWLQRGPDRPELAALGPRLRDRLRASVRQLRVTCVLSSISGLYLAAAVATLSWRRAQSCAQAVSLGCSPTSSLGERDMSCPVA